MNRRDALLRSLQGVGAAFAWQLGVRPRVLGAEPVHDAGSADYLDHAVGAARWLRSHRIPTEHGVTWPWNPEEQPRQSTHSLYSGAPGIVVFLLELGGATGNAEYLAEARAGADELIDVVDRASDIGDGLYTGLAGYAFVLHEMHRATGDEKYRAATVRILDRLVSRARRAGAGVEWNDVTDIISGSAGTGLVLLQLGRELRHDSAVAVAVAAGRRLVELGEPAAGGLKWPMAPDQQKYPNFSHGTGGVAYFLATLHDAAPDAGLLKAAIAGADYLLATATRTSDGCLIFHHEPGGEDLFYLSWCHGPPGTARLFTRLASVTGERRWTDAGDCLTAGLLATGAPEKRSAGYWNNVGQCCGDAGVGEYFLSLHRQSKRAEHLEVASRAARHLIARATTDAASGGMKWIHAEHRVRPEWTVPQTGYMQGAAGIGSFFVHMDAASRERSPRVRWPDSPWV